jgi:hypothetical protein
MLSRTSGRLSTLTYSSIRAARRKRDDDADLPGWKFLCGRRRNQDDTGRDRERRENAVHGILPEVSVIGFCRFFPGSALLAAGVLE